MRASGGAEVVLGTSLLAALLMAVPVVAQDAIHFERDFPGSVPDQFEVRLTQDGEAVYTERGEAPLDLKVGEEAAGVVFELAAGLDYFSKPLASQRKVASTGRKVLRYESGGAVRGEAEFDYSEDPQARDIASWFIKLSETQQHLQELERVYRFDRLGVNHALVSLEQAYERDRIVAPDLLLPILGKIAEEDRIVHLARARAEGMLERIRAGRGDPE